jgi:hypothetical protein
LNPPVVERTERARALLIDARQEADGEYEKAEAEGDAVATTVWARAVENIGKLALLYAVSADHKDPQIDHNAVEWATKFAMCHTRRMLTMASRHVADSRFDADCLKVLGLLRAAPLRQLGHSELLRKMKKDTRKFGDLIKTLLARRDIVVDNVPTGGRSAKVYRLVA